MCNHVNVFIEKIKETPKIELYSTRCIRCLKESMLSIPKFRIIINIDENDDGILITANTLNYIRSCYSDNLREKYQIEKSKNLVNEISGNCLQ